MALPQSGQVRVQQHPGLPTFMPPNATFDAPPYFSMDSSQAAKQMAALSAASQARIANTRPTPLLNPSSGADSGLFIGGMNPSNYSAATSFDDSHAAQMSPSHGVTPSLNLSTFVDPSMPHQGSAPRQANNSPLRQRQQGFLLGLANVMATRGTPLPPALTGVPTPSYDPNTSLWKSLEVSPEVGHFRLAGKDINLLKLWGSVFQSGGGHAVSANNSWSAIAAQFNLPDEIAQEPPNAGTTSVAHTIAQYYMVLLHPFEQYYKNNLQEQQKRALAASRQLGAQGSQLSNTSGRPIQGVPAPAHPGQSSRGVTNALLTSLNPTIAGMDGSSQTQPSPDIPHQPSTPTTVIQSNSNSIPSFNNPDGSLDDLLENPPDSNVLDPEMQGIKRKMDDDDRDGKRTRQKIETISQSGVPLVDRSSSATNSGIVTTPTSTTMTLPSRPRQQPSRRKIEYVPLAREVESHGGRDLKLLDHELRSFTRRRPIRDVNDWGAIEIEALILSLRSRLSLELSYALTTFTLLSTMGFPIVQSPDLFDEMLDLLEDSAFGHTEEITEIDPPVVISHIPTNRALLHVVSESQSLPFSVLQPSQGLKDPEFGPRQRPGNIILAIMNIIRNLSTVPDNLDFISRHTKLVDMVLRICSMTEDSCGALSPASQALSLGDLIAIRRDTLYLLTNIAGNVHLFTPTPTVTLRMARRVFQLLSSYLIDPAEAVSPLACVHFVGIAPNANVKPPLLADVALEVFGRLSQNDANRRILAESIPPESLLRLFEALVHRLPVVDADFQLMTRDIWLSYLEKIIMAIYSLAFLSPPAVKARVKADRVLGFKSVMFRLIQKFLMTPSADGRNWFIVCTRRAIEAMKVLDDGEDSFDTPKSTGPAMSFGMGFGEVGDKETETGAGLLGGHRDIAWDMLMLREVYGDEVMFAELESLARVNVE